MNWNQKTLTVNFADVKCCLLGRNEKDFLHRMVIKNRSTAITKVEKIMGTHVVYLVESLLELTIEHNWWVWAKHSGKNTPFKTYLATINWGVLSHQPFAPYIAPSDDQLFRSMAYDLVCVTLLIIEDTKNWVALRTASNNETFFQRDIRMLPERRKSSS